MVRRIASPAIRLLAAAGIVALAACADAPSAPAAPETVSFEAIQGTLAEGDTNQTCRGGYGSEHGRCE